MQPVLPRRPPAWLVGAGGALLLAAIAFVHIGLGAAGVGPAAVLDLITGGASEQAESVLLGSRLPRTLAGLVTGLALGVAGTLIQGATRNQLGAPDTLGVNAGAYFAVALVAVLGLGSSTLLSTAAAFLGGALALGLMLLVAGKGVLTPGRILLAGATVTLAGMSAAEFLQLLDEQATKGIFFWGNGTLLQSGLDRPAVLGAVILAASIPALLLSRPLDLMALGDESAQAMGVRVTRTRAAAFVIAVLLSASAVTVAGPIGFVGLMAPVAMRLLGVRRHAALLPMAGLTGAVLVLTGDAAAQLAFPPSAGYGELPVGVITALLGGPVFVLLARRAITGDVDTGAAVAVARAHRHRCALSLLGGILVLAAAVLAGLRYGDVDLSWAQLVDVLIGSGDPTSQAVVSFRVPRVLVALLAGACLAVAGTAVQSVVRNPLAEPGLLGVTAGASAGAVFVIIAIPSAPAAFLPLSAALGGIAAVGLVHLLARDRTGLDPTRAVLVGIGVMATGSAVVNLLVVSAQMDLSAALTWLAGSTYARGYSALGWLVVPGLVAALLAIAARPVNMLGLGDDLPRTLGLDLARARLLVLVAAAVLAAGTASAIGTVGFVGLVAPHLARRLVGNTHQRLVPVAALVGAALVATADVVGRVLLAPVEIPVGIITALIGTPYLVWLLRRTPT